MAEQDPDREARDDISGAGATDAGEVSQSPAELAGGSGDGSLEDDEYFEDMEDEDFDEPAETVDESGRRHIRRAAPAGTEEILQSEQPRHTGLPDRLEAWRRRSATGAVLTAFAMGLQEALETERKEPAIIMQTSGEPPFDLPVQAQLETLGPRQSTVSLRPWLLDKEGSTDDPDASTTSTGPAEASAGSAPADEPPDSGPVGTGDK